ncbi:hypothetical protein [Paenibacillus macerans]|uniref:hypothetical protein n=1 Tax=Paenibacillus macerans TaxID=44252 RepID=UPI00203E8938|nr:hypothetical protein [Paenibacillus macerans]MCM3703957.1 hypothetical protein [Paenibacillus macerans]
MKSADPETNATFYHYRLLKKVVLPKALIYGFATLPFLWLAAEMIFLSWTSLFFFLIAAPIALWIQFVISRSVLIILSHSYRKRWRFSRLLPWIGYMPEQYVAYSVFRKVHLHAAWIGCCIIAVIIPWSPASFVLALFFWHFWLIGPRLLVLACVRGQRKDGMLKITGLDISYYLQ